VGRIAGSDAARIGTPGDRRLRRLDTSVPEPDFLLEQPLYENYLDFWPRAVIWSTELAEGSQHSTRRSRFAVDTT